MNDIDLDKVVKSDEPCILDEDRRGKAPGVFEPMRRRMELIPVQIETSSIVERPSSEAMPS